MSVEFCPRELIAEAKRKRRKRDLIEQARQQSAEAEQHRSQTEHPQPQARSIVNADFVANTEWCSIK